MSPWILAARPKTLSAAVVPVLVGTALAAPAIDWLMFACALGGALLIQIGTNYVNDALDFKKGADTSERLGPLRVTQAGLLPAGSVLRAAYGCFFAAALCGIPLVIRAGWPLLAIGLTSIAAAYLYTGGPYPLAYHGLGEIFVIVFFGVIAVGGSHYVQALSVTRDVMIAGVAIGFLASALLAINNLRDIPTDRASGKRTLAARAGASFARGEVAFFAFAPFAAVAVMAVLRRQWAVLLPLLALPMAMLLVRRVWSSEGAGLNRCLALAGGLQWLFGILFASGVLFR